MQYIQDRSLCKGKMPRIGNGIQVVVDLVIDPKGVVAYEFQKRPQNIVEKSGAKALIICRKPQEPQ